MLLALKSGNFGGPEFFSDALKLDALMAVPVPELCREVKRDRSAVVFRRFYRSDCWVFLLAYSFPAFYRIAVIDGKATPRGAGALTSLHSSGTGTAISGISLSASEKKFRTAEIA